MYVCSHQGISMNASKADSLLSCATCWKSATVLYTIFWSSELLHKRLFFLMLHAFRVRPYHPKYDLGWTRCCHNPKSKRCLGCGCPGSRYGSLVLASCSNRWCNGITDVGATRNGEGGVQKERNSKLRIEKDFCCLAVALQSVGQNSA